MYPPGWGDLTTAQSLFSGINIALHHRLRNGGFGQLVDTALMRVGAWIVSPYIARSSAAEEGPGPLIPDYHFEKETNPFNDVYETADHETFALLGEGREA